MGPSTIEQWGKTGRMRRGLSARKKSPIHFLLLSTYSSQNSFGAYYNYTPHYQQADLSHPPISSFKSKPRFYPFDWMAGKKCGEFDSNIMRFVVYSQTADNLPCPLPADQCFADDQSYSFPKGVGQKNIFLFALFVYFLSNICSGESRQNLFNKN